MKTKRIETTTKNVNFEFFNENALSNDELFVIRGGDGEEDPNPEVIIEPEL